LCTTYARIAAFWLAVQGLPGVGTHDTPKMFGSWYASKALFMTYLPRITGVQRAGYILEKVVESRRVKFRA
jgi:hypothetical protein